MNDAYRQVPEATSKRACEGRETLGYYIDGSHTQPTSRQMGIIPDQPRLFRGASRFDLAGMVNLPPMTRSSASGTDSLPWMIKPEAVARRNAGKRMTYVGGFTPWAFGTQSSLVASIKKCRRTEVRRNQCPTMFTPRCRCSGIMPMANASFFCHQRFPSGRTAHTAKSCLQRVT